MISSKNTNEWIVERFFLNAYNEDAAPGDDENDENIIKAVERLKKEELQVLVNTFQDTLDTNTDEQLITILYDRFNCQQRPFLQYDGPFRDARDMLTHIISVLSKRL